MDKQKAIDLLEEALQYGYIEYDPFYENARLSYKGFKFWPGGVHTDSFYTDYSLCYGPFGSKSMTTKLKNMLDAWEAI